MAKTPTMDGLKFVTFPDGCDSGLKQSDALQGFMSELERLGSQALTGLLIASANEGRPVTCIIYGILIPWVAEVARSLTSPPHFFGVNLSLFLISIIIIFVAMESSFARKSVTPRLPLNYQDCPCSVAVTFPVSYSPQMQMNTTSSFSVSEAPRDAPPLAVLSKQQSEEIARGLLDSGRPFLWVIRAKEKGEEEKEEDKLSCYARTRTTRDDSTMVFSVVAFPQWTDQSTNAKLAEDVWKTGVRVTVNQEGIVEADEIKRCLELVMGDGEEAKEMRRNANKWKDLAREAVMEGGSSGQEP
ncbi:UDP-glycosyltransferase 75D1 [Vitis vinifera]|uniref:UDP-glycosyltransferase 75D1 n=1 Tax=Vitis vinifera TaxID=29760 RepID=A0A438CGF6_VITVI|nr:UDP-glycosyltransferase 75D1 [Vitis vinifera]